MVFNFFSFVKRLTITNKDTQGKTFFLNLCIYLKEKLEEKQYILILYEDNEYELKIVLISVAIRLNVNT